MRPNLLDDGWELENVLERHQQDRDGFWIPPYVERMMVEPGLRVQISVRMIAEDASGLYIVSERLWVDVTDVAGLHYHGTLASQPLRAAALTRGAELDFGPDHVANIMYPRVQRSRHAVLK